MSRLGPLMLVDPLDDPVGFGDRSRGDLGAGERGFPLGDPRGLRGLLGRSLPTRDLGLGLPVKPGTAKTSSS
eukprot:2963562-Amphidinium_carterae.1